MPRISLETVVSLPPRPISRRVARELLRLAFEEFQWFKPAQYGFGSRNPPPEGPIEYDYILEALSSMGTAIVIGRTDDYFLFLGVPEEPHRHIGKFSWVVPARKAAKASWREEHQRQVVLLMQLLDSPLAYSALFNDIEAKGNRLVKQDFGSSQESTVSNYSQGLAGVYWRNFYGAPFIRLFGERLRALPPECVTWLGEERVLVQPYGLPTEAGSEAAREQERRFIHLLGPECFYDFEHHLKPTRVPELLPISDDWPVVNRLEEP